MPSLPQHAEYMTDSTSKAVRAEAPLAFVVGTTLAFVAFGDSWLADLDAIGDLHRSRDDLGADAQRQEQSDARS
jgi:hypothetical protein